jgi:C4-dicarboxylate-specific signal transduction histidine kinase
MAASSADLVAALADAMTVVKPKLSQADIVLEVELPDLPEVTGSRIGLAQVLSNLLNNAADAVAASPGGPRWIHVAGWCQESEITIEVADSGGGIPEQLLPRVFAPFFTTKVSGTGLGLAVCQRNMQAVGGEIRVRNGEAGAVFTLTFSRAAQPPPRHAGAQAPRACTPAEKGLGRGASAAA